MSKEPKLKPCPFCGSTYVMVGESDKIYADSIKFSEPICFVECMNCRSVAGLYKKNYSHEPNYDARKKQSRLGTHEQRKKVLIDEYKHCKSKGIQLNQKAHSHSRWKPYLYRERKQEFE